ncbi:hypothetical protein KVR01_013556 [Diaporthe batatas]|uniref:uncharacterized protein n=1 Tax=Diaporthe batatas TaxID=748121 RepID=UPI001D05A2EA|nr:uncharacterized protein KVR01_013556 [Diaporthe batatas]KAG8156605.1 hypothetical protein KVR01_013556 [Diaporthe batatas]
MSVPPSFGYNTKFNELVVKHCMAEPNPDYVCKIGLVPPLLLIVIGCVFVKGCICVAVLSKLRHDSLVTPGDAIASFISQPDPNTARLATLSFADADRLENKSIANLPLRRTGAFGKSSTTNISIQFSYLGALLMANISQPILSTCYYTLNSFITRIQIEEEFSSYSRCYKPLRVSDPKGDQISSYRLQLPYKYSIPLIAISIVLHWLLSSAIFLNIIEGGFWANRKQDNSIASSFGVSDGSYVAVGVSGSAFLALFVVAAVLCISLALFSLRRIPVDMVCGGSSSLVLSAACHAPITVQSDVSSGSNVSQAADEDELQLPSDAMTEGEEMVLRHEMATSKVRWGAMPATPEMLEGIMIDCGEVMGWIGFR